MDDGSTLARIFRRDPRDSDVLGKRPGLEADNPHPQLVLGLAHLGTRLGRLGIARGRGVVHVSRGDALLTHGAYDERHIVASRRELDRLQLLPGLDRQRLRGGIRPTPAARLGFFLPALAFAERGEKLALLGLQPAGRVGHGHWPVVAACELPQGAGVRVELPQVLRQHELDGVAVRSDADLLCRFRAGVHEPDAAARPTDVEVDAAFATPRGPIASDAPTERRGRQRRDLGFRELARGQARAVDAVPGIRIGIVAWSGPLVPAEEDPAPVGRPAHVANAQAEPTVVPRSVAQAHRLRRARGCGDERGLP